MSRGIQSEKNYQKFTAVLLSAILILSLIPLGVMTAGAETVTVNEEKTILSVSVKERYDMELIDGDWINAFDEDNIYLGRYFKYRYEPDIDSDDVLTVLFEDGTEFSGAIWYFESIYEMPVSFDSDQSYENQWGVGTNKAEITLGTQTFEYDVTVFENPIESLEVAPVTVIEGNWVERSYYIDEEWIDYPV